MSEEKKIKRVSRASLSNDKIEAETPPETSTIKHQEIIKKAPEPKKIVKQPQKKPLHTVQQQVTAKPKVEDKQKYKLTDDEDLFEDIDEINEDDDLEDESNNLRQRIDELLAVLNQLVEKLADKLSVIFLKISTKILKPIIKVLLKMVTVLARMFRINPKRLEEQRQKKQKEQVQEEEEVIEEQLSYGSFTDVSKINIIFTDNFDTPFYRNTGETVKFAKTEEGIMFGNSIEAIKQCAKFVENHPPVKEGYFENREMSDIMENVNQTEIELFLGYVKSRPKKYIGKKWKISETFATWLDANAPMAFE